MSTIIQRTNPDAWQGRYKCAACKQVHGTADEARECAETDHATQRHKRRPR